MKHVSEKIYIKKHKEANTKTNNKLALENMQKNVR